jgi:ABC-type sugar transport system ATPase subunit
VGERMKKDNSYVLKAVEISKSFPGVKALDKVSLNVKRGEVHAIVGENGAGKSTLIKIITGIYSSDEGTIYINSEIATINRVRDSKKYGISCIYQDPEFALDISIAENIFMGELPRNGLGFISRRKLYKETGKLLEMFNLEFNPQTILEKLSTAQRQLVEIIKAFSKKSKIIIMDEPTAALTADEIEKLFNIIRKLKSQGIAIIYISHRMDEIFDVADRVTIFRDGRHIDTLVISEADHEQVIELMIGRTLKNLFPKVKAEIGKDLLCIKDFNKEGIFENISFSMKKNEILGIAGLVGSGRSELAESIFGVKKVDSGKVFINDKEIKIGKVHDSIRNSICMTAEERKSQGLFLDHSVNDNINIVSLNNISRLGFISDRRGRNQTKNFVDALSIMTPSIKQQVQFLSGGNQQKVVLGKWLAMKPKVLILNEPTKGVDVGAKSELYAIAGKLIESGNTSIIVFSSEILELVSVCDRILVIFKGKIVKEFNKNSKEWDENIEKKVLSYSIKGR